MADNQYQNREIDAMFVAVHDRFDIQDKTLSRIEKEVLPRMEVKQDFTNGKLRKIIVAMVLLFGFVLGVMGKELLPLLAKFLI